MGGLGRPYARRLRRGGAIYRYIGPYQNSGFWAGRVWATLLNPVVAWQFPTPGAEGTLYRPDALGMGGWLQFAVQLQKGSLRAKSR